MNQFPGELYAKPHGAEVTTFRSVDAAREAMIELRSNDPYEDVNYEIHMYGTKGMFAISSFVDGEYEGTF